MEDTGLPSSFPAPLELDLQRQAPVLHFRSAAFSGGRRLAFVAILGLVLTSTEHTEIVLSAAILFFLSKTAVLA